MKPTKQIEDAEAFETNGYMLMPKALQPSIIYKIQIELLNISRILQPDIIFKDLNQMWNFHKKVNRNKASLIYNAFKHLHSVKKLGISKTIESVLKQNLSMVSPVLVDINCRIDSRGEEKFLFDWHQDYWFSVCSPSAVVIWVPIMELVPATGGLEIIGNKHTKGRILKSKPRVGVHNSYADAVILDEDVSCYQSLSIQSMKIGDILGFKFNTLHKSIPVESTELSRFTVQFRFADFADNNFINEQYKPRIVNTSKIDDLARENQ